MIKIIGTTHLIPKEEIEKSIKLFNPDVIGVELCETRFKLMVLPILENTEVIKNDIQDNSLIGKISSKVKEKAENENLQYGSDMISASIYAKENGLSLEFIDRDIIETKEDMEHIPKEEFNYFLKELEKLELSDLKKEVDEEVVLSELKTKTPISFRILITMRDLFIANKILILEKKYPKEKILIFVGKGHVKGLNKLLGLEYD
jgi:pheromone shutdown protein TraB